MRTELIFRASARSGLPGVPKGSLVLIKKGIFGLPTSPRQWWSRVIGVLLKLRFQDPATQKYYTVVQSRLDPCWFLIRDEETNLLAGQLATHVDDILMSGNEQIVALMRNELKREFALEEWEALPFSYCGIQY